MINLLIPMPPTSSGEYEGLGEATPPLPDSDVSYCTMYRIVDHITHSLTPVHGSQPQLVLGAGDGGVSSCFNN